MNAERYLVLIHFAAKTTRANLAEVASQVDRSIKMNLRNSEAICTTLASLAFVGESDASVNSLFRALADDLHPGDNLSIFLLGRQVVTSHAGLERWHRERQAKCAERHTPPSRGQGV